MDKWGVSQSELHTCCWVFQLINKMLGSVMVFNSTFNTIWDILWRSFYWWTKPEYQEKTNDLVGFELTALVVIDTDYIRTCNCKSNYHTITTMMAPSIKMNNNMLSMCTYILWTQRADLQNLKYDMICRIMYWKKSSLM